MFPLETKRLILRPFIEEDLEEIYRLVYAEEEVREAWSGYTGTLTQFRERFAKEDTWHAEDGFGFLAVLLKEENRLLGLMGYQKFEPGEDTGHMVFEDPDDEMGRDAKVLEVELTYALGRVYWGKGYASEAGKALIELGFRELGIGRIVNAVIIHEKHGSLPLMKRLGFRIVRNLNPEYMTVGAFKGLSGAIGILERTAWEKSRSFGS